MSDKDRRLELVRGALHAWATGELDGALPPSRHADLGRSLVSVERWLTGEQRGVPELDVKRAHRALSDARAQRRLPYSVNAVYWYLRALRFARHPVFGASGPHPRLKP